VPSGLDLGTAGGSLVGGFWERGGRRKWGGVRVPFVLLVVDPAGAEGELFLHVLEEFVAEVVDAD
jgi:hypothetical protein